MDDLDRLIDHLQDHGIGCRRTSEPGEIPDTLHISAFFDRAVYHLTLRKVTEDVDDELAKMALSPKYLS
jgi:hypothetical protein